MNLSSELYERICMAADALHAQGGGAAFPTVDAVRKAAKVSMNDASAGMREWRRAHTVQAGMAATSVPEKIREAGLAALAGIWNEPRAWPASRCAWRKPHGKPNAEKQKRWRGRWPMPMKCWRQNCGAARSSSPVPAVLHRH